ncbi:MAG: (2Fe-2S)-binding protein [Bilifractor sp.]|jgi:NAD(P)H-nitrite reductase large subunit
MSDECKCRKDGDDVVICRCEEITKAAIEEAIRNGCHDLDAVKRATRAGMGMCQSKSCSTVIARMISQIAGVPASEVKPFTKRPPLRPISVDALTDKD